MHNFSTLYLFELRKILDRRLWWIASVIVLLLGLVTVFSDIMGNYYVDGVVLESNYEGMRRDAKYARALNGRAIDQTLLEEMQAAYRRVPADRDRYSLTESYQVYARPYSAVLHYADNILGFSSLEELQNWTVDEQALWDARRQNQEEQWDALGLTKGEKNYWEKKEEALLKPIVFYSAEGYSRLGSMFYTFAIVIILHIAICLSGVFSKEHTRHRYRHPAAYNGSDFAGTMADRRPALCLSAQQPGQRLGRF